MSSEVEAPLPTPAAGNESVAEFKFRITQQLSSLQNADEILLVASAEIGKYLHLDRCYFQESIPGTETVVILADWRSDASSVPIDGTYKLSEYGKDEWWETVRKGPIGIDDVSKHPWTADFIEQYRALEFGGYALGSFIRDGQWISSIGIASRKPRHWKPSEISLLENTIARIWPQVERARAVFALKRSEEKYRTLFEAIDEGFCIIELLYDENGTPCDYLFEEVNPAFEKHSGLIGVVGQTVQEVTQFVEPHWLERYSQLVQSGEAMRFEDRFDSLNRWFEVSCLRIGGSGSRRIAALFTDTTARKKAEIEQRLAREAAEAANRAKDNFLASLSHELRTPLTPVLMAAATLRDDPRLPTDARKDLAMIERNIALEARLIDDLLDLTRISRGKLPMRSELCDVHSLLAYAVEIIRDEAQTKRVELGMEMKALRSGLHGDPARLQQVFWNLLKNAIKFTPSGGRIDILTENMDGSLMLEVRDTGIGFDPEVAERLFEPFEQAGREGDHRFGGLGLGLAIAQAVVRLHGGELIAESEGVGKGANFRVALPGAAEPPQQAEETVPEPPTRLEHNAMRLLLVEDHEPTLAVLSRLLSRAGHTVFTASSVKSALALAENERFDAVVSDLGLPDGTGLELMTKLRKSRPTLFGIALSGYGMESDLLKSKEAGFTTHLVKPIDFSQLRRALSGLAHLPKNQSLLGSEIAG